MKERQEDNEGDLVAFHVHEVGLERLELALALALRAQQLGVFLLRRLQLLQTRLHVAQLALVVLADALQLVVAAAAASSSAASSSSSAARSVVRRKAASSHTRSTRGYPVKPGITR